MAYKLYLSQTRGNHSQQSTEMFQQIFQWRNKQTASGLFWLADSITLPSGWVNSFKIQFATVEHHGGKLLVTQGCVLKDHFYNGVGGLSWCEQHVAFSQPPQSIEMHFHSICFRLTYCIQAVLGMSVPENLQGGQHGDKKNQYTVYHLKMTLWKWMCWAFS